MTQINVLRVNGWYPPLACCARAPVDEAVLEQLCERTDHYWLVLEDAPLLFVGGINTNLIGNDLYLWAVPFVDLAPRHLRPMLRAFRKETEAFGKVWMQAAPDAKVGIRFAEFFGLKHDKELSMPGLEFYGSAY